MSRTIYIIFEGDGKLVPGFNAFLRSAKGAARQRGINVRPVAGGARAVRDFNWARRDLTDATVLLLVDSEGPAPRDPRDSVRSRGDWTPSRPVEENEVHLMVQLMEAWFLADRDALRVYYGQHFRENRLKGDPANVEKVTKNDVLSGLNAATKETSKGKYHKVNHGRALLSKIDPERVRKAAPHCDRLFCVLQHAIDTDGESSN